MVENTFTSVPDMIDEVFPVLSNFKSLCSNKWNTLELMPNITRPILFLSGEKDELVPPRHMKALHSAATSSMYCNSLKP